MRILPGVALAWLLGSTLSAFAQSNVETGALAFRKCTACHAITTENGDIVRKGGKLGPDLYGIVGKPAAVDTEFKYGSSLVEAGENGLIWTEENFVGYVENPRKFLEKFLDTFKIQNKMAYKLPRGGRDIYAYLEDLDRPDAADSEDAPVADR